MGPHQQILRLVVDEDQHLGHCELVHPDVHDLFGRLVLLKLLEHLESVKQVLGNGVLLVALEVAPALGRRIVLVVVSILLFL